MQIQSGRTVPLKTALKNAQENLQIRQDIFFYFFFKMRPKRNKDIQTKTKKKERISANVEEGWHIFVQNISQLVLQEPLKDYLRFVFNTIMSSSAKPAISRQLKSLTAIILI
jgi:hypothetical protein